MHHYINASNVGSNKLHKLKLILIRKIFKTQQTFSFRTLIALHAKKKH